MFIYLLIAFMAPEVITRNEKEGTGRASDIWSVACVVIEMTTGKVENENACACIITHLSMY